MKNKLRVIRAELNISQKQLADMAGISRVTVSNIESESIIPNGDTMFKLCKALERPVEQIFLDFV